MAKHIIFQLVKLEFIIPWKIYGIAVQKCKLENVWQKLSAEDFSCLLDQIID
jgi:hypothetical protein